MELIVTIHTTSHTELDWPLDPGPLCYLSWLYTPSWLGVRAGSWA